MIDVMIILAHGAIQDRFDAHLPLWMAVPAGLRKVICPRDDRIKTNLPMVELGSSLSREDQIQRMKAAISSLVGRKGMIFEWDSIPLGTDFIVDELFRGNPQISGDATFVAPRYLNAPWAFGRETARRLFAVHKEYPWMSEHNQADRWISALAHIGGIPMLPHLPRGFSKGTLVPAHFEELELKILDGAALIHGVKTAEALQVCLAAERALRARDYGVAALELRSMAN